ncbi:hypothetical protein P0W64_19070 [Tsukamurella sp. 8F]|uniref:hypothetical protein n=1 Tax=unclassified Tsukamurella TaxID=2633480 RepID=UPI0023B8CE9E|nr:MULTISPECIES: hypothetical protein [unclassified Tsukamurella]MDF0531988.1 hypothetical protein [Tsukamurella sp. 8J]MDF0588887.1 hypothetical protein [Tsukamurella sp. 8F]
MKSHAISALPEIPRAVTAAFAAMIAVMGLLGVGVWAAPSAHAEPATPTGAQLTTELNIIADTSQPTATRAALLEGGTAAVIRVNIYMAALKANEAANGYTVSWAVDNGPITVAGTTATTNITLTKTTTSSGATDTAPINGVTWVYLGDTWKLTNAGVCKIGSFGGQSCGLS